MQTARTTLARLGALVLCLAFIAPPAAADDTNAALRYWTVWSVTFPNVAEIWKGVPRADFGDPDAVFDDEALHLMNGHKAMIHALRRASTLTRCDFAIEWELGPHVLLTHLSKARQSANLLLSHARVAFDGGDASEGVRSLTAAFRLSEQLSRDGTLVSSLVSAAVFAQCNKLLVYVNERGALDADARRALASALATFSAKDPFRTARAIANEHKYFVGWIRREAHEDDRAELLDFFVNGLGHVEADAERTQRLAEAIRTGEGLERLITGYDECMTLIADAWLLPEPSVVIDHLMKCVERGDYGDMAAMLVTSYPRTLEQRARAESLLAGAITVVAADH